MSVREIRQHWPEAERALARFGEIVVTRDSCPVARILPYVDPLPARRPHFDPQAQRRWLDRFWSRQPEQPSTDLWLSRDRDDAPPTEVRRSKKRVR